VPAPGIRPTIGVQLLLAAESPAVLRANVLRLRKGLPVMALSAEVGPRPHVAVPPLGPVRLVRVGAAAHLVKIVLGCQDFVFEAPPRLPSADRPHAVCGVVLID